MNSLLVKLFFFSFSSLKLSSQPVISQIIGMFDIIYSIAIKFYKIKKKTSMEGQESLQVTWNIDYCLKFSEQYVSYIQDENKFNDI